MSFFFRDFLTNYHKYLTKTFFFNCFGAFSTGLDPSKKMRVVRTIHFHPLSRLELRHVSENEGFRRWNEVRKCGFCVLKWGLRSGDALAKWPTVVRLPSGLAHGRRTPEAPGSNPKVWLLLLWWCVLCGIWRLGKPIISEINFSLPYFIKLYFLILWIMKLFRIHH